MFAYHFFFFSFWNFFFLKFTESAAFMRDKERKSLKWLHLKSSFFFIFSLLTEVSTISVSKCQLCFNFHHFFQFFTTPTQKIKNWMKMPTDCQISSPQYRQSYQGHIITYNYMALNLILFINKQPRSAEFVCK